MKRSKPWGPSRLSQPMVEPRPAGEANPWLDANGNIVDPGPTTCTQCGRRALDLTSGQCPAGHVTEGNKMKVGLSP